MDDFAAHEYEPTPRGAPIDADEAARKEQLLAELSDFQLAILDAVVVFMDPAALADAIELYAPESAYLEQFFEAVMNLPTYGAWISKSS
jgi:hypothetical protein